MAKYFGALLDDGVDAEGIPSWNVGPTRDLLALTPPRHEPGWHQADQPVLSTYRWGLIPSWAKDVSVGSRLFNARAETVATRASFKAAFAARRAVITVDGFFEWRKAPGAGRQPHYFTRTDGGPLALAGLYEFWRDPSRADDDDQRWVRSCTIITTRASQDMDGIHDRMPAVLGADTLERWLEPDGADSNELRALLLAPPPGTLVHHRVDPRVGNVRNDDAQLIEPLAASSPRQVPTEGGLFDPGND